MTATLPRPDVGLRRWNSREWQDVRRAAYLTLVDMTVFPSLRSDGVPWSNALRESAVEHHLIDRASSRPTETLLRLNPWLQEPGETA